MPRRLTYERPKPVLGISTALSLEAQELSLRHVTSAQTETWKSAAQTHTVGSSQHPDHDGTVT